MKVDVSVEELVALLKKTSLPTIIVEGSDDMIVFRRFEEALAHFDVSVLAAGGRNKVLEIFNRRSELPPTNKVVFIADQDTWIHAGIPPAYHSTNLIFTDGYSLENDIYRDGELWRILQGTDLTAFEAELSSFIEWYALALSRHLIDPEASISLHPEHVLNQTTRTALMTLAPGEIYPTPLMQAIEKDYARLLRGKSLMALLIRHTNKKQRGVRHNDGALIEAIAIRPGPLLSGLRQRVEQCFATP